MIDVGTIKIGDKRIAAWSFEPEDHDDPFAYEVTVVGSERDSMGVKVGRRIYHVVDEAMAYSPGSIFYMTGYGLFKNTRQAKTAIALSYFGLGLKKNVKFKRDNIG